MTNTHRSTTVRRLLPALAALLVSACSQSLTPPFPDIAPFPTKVLSKDEQAKAIDELNAAREAQARQAEAKEPGGRSPVVQPVVQQAVSKSSLGAER